MDQIIKEKYLNKNIEKNHIRYNQKSNYGICVNTKSSIFQHVILDPSAFTSTKHIESLLYSEKKYELFLSPTLIDLLNDGNIDIIFNYFSWKNKKDSKLSEDTFLLLRELKP